MHKWLARLSLLFITLDANAEIKDVLPQKESTIGGFSICQKIPERPRPTKTETIKKVAVSTGIAASPFQRTENNLLDTHSIVLNCGTAVLPSKDQDTEDEGSVKRWLDFLKDITIALAWPAVAIIAIWRMGPEFKQKIPKLKSFEAGPLKAEFSEDVEAVRREAEAQFPQQQEEREVSSEEKRLIELAKVSPRASIIEAWRAVETTAAKIVRLKTEPSIVEAGTFSQSIGFESHVRPKSPIALAKELSSLAILNPQQLLVFHELRILRNQAAHAEQFDMEFESANNYIQSALALRATIESQS